VGHFLRRLLLTAQENLHLSSLLGTAAIGAIAYATTSAVVFVTQGPRLAKWWPVAAVLLAGGDVDSPPRFDHESRVMLRSVLLGSLETEEDLLRADDTLSRILDRHPEYWNVHGCRAGVRWRLGRIDEAVADEQRSDEAFDAGGFYMSYDSDRPEDYPPHALSTPINELWSYMADKEADGEAPEGHR